MKYYLAIDIGASSGRHMVSESPDGHFDSDVIELTEIYRFSNGAVEKDGHLVWDIDKLLSYVKIGIGKALELYPQIESLAIDTWGVDYLLMRDGKPVYPAFSYRDSRTADVIDAVHSIVSREELYAHTGIQFQPFNTIYQLYADKQAGRLDNAYGFLMIPEYLTYCLTGNAVREFTNASTTGLLNAFTGEWDFEIIDRLGLPRELFPALSMPGTVVGEYLGIPVKLCASHDTASAFEAVDADDNTLILSSGTWSLLGIKSREPIISDKSREHNWTNEKGIGYTRFLKNIDGLYTIGLVRKEFGFGFDEAEELARSGAIEKLTLAYRSLAAKYAQAVREIEEICGREFDNIVVIGGGAKDKYLTELTAEYTKKNVVAKPIEATAIGNILSQRSKI
jgi:Sugar (pentulose and hexulose) kinases